MSISHPLKRGVIAVAAALSLLAMAPASHAGVIGSFDPQFGGMDPSLNNVGFQGTFDLNVSNACYAQASPYVFTGNGCTITVNSITVGFYDSSTYTPSPGSSPTFIRSYTLNASTMTFAVPGEQNYVTGAYFDPTTDRLLSFDTRDSNDFDVSIHENPDGSGNCTSGNICYDGSMILYFTSGYAGGGVSSFSSTNAARAPVTGSAYLVNCNLANDEEAGPMCSRDGYDNSDPAGVVVTSDPGPLPEPETMPLTLIGLGALALSGWRRRPGSVSRAG